jgi:hypothetical protein
MPTQAEARRARNILNANIAHGLGGPKGFSQKDWARMAAAIPDWQGVGKSSDRGALGAIGGAFKSAGSASLNALSVPQAILFTLGSKTIEGLSGRKGMDWSDALGGFSEGYKGYREILEQAGVPKDSGWAKWGGLVGDIALDPLWFVAPAKVARTPGTLAKLAEVANVGVSGTRATANVAKAISKDAGTTAMLGKFKDASNAGKSVKAAIKAEGQRVVKGHRVTVQKGAGAAEKTDRALGSAVGDLVDGRYFITQVTKGSKKAGGEKAQYRVFDLGDNPTVLRSQDKAFTPRFKNKTEAREWVKSSLDEADGLDPKVVSLMDEGVAHLDDYDKGLAMNSKQVKEVFNGGKNQMGIRVGWGKTNPAGGKGLSGKNFVFNTRIPLPANKALGGVTGLDKLGTFRRSPFARAVHQLSRSGNEMGNASMQMWLHETAKRFRLTDEQAELIGHGAVLDNMSHPGVDKAFMAGRDMFIQQAKKDGLWNDDMDRALAFVRERMQTQRQRTGKGDYTFRGQGVEEAERKAFVEGAYDKAYKKAVKAGKSEEEAIALGEKAGKKAAKQYKARTRGDYTLQTPTRESLREQNADVIGAGYGAKTMRNEIKDTARKHSTALNYVTKEEYAADLERLGFSPDTAKNLADAAEIEMSRLGQFFKKKDAKTLAFADEPGALKPEMNILKLGAYADRRYIRNRLMKEIDDLAVDAGLGSFDKKGKLVFTDAKTERIYNQAIKTFNGGLLADSVGWNKYLHFVSGLKMYLTTSQPQHYVSNTFGDYFKDFVQGNRRHFKFDSSVLQWTGKKGKRATKGSDYAKMASGEWENMKKQKWVIGGNEYTPEEVYFMSHMVGLGKGYAGDEIMNIYKLGEEASGPPGIKQLKTYARFGARQNATREDSGRIQAWMRWMEGGDDPMTAGLKTITSRFDYADLTDFEKVFLRNFILFYTWSRKNIPFQFKGMARRPGLYSAYGDIERDREKMPFEPDYISEMGLLPLPGLGAFQMFAPHADLNKVPLDPRHGWESLRKLTISSLPPPFKQAGERMTGVDFFTGGKVANKGELQYWLKQFGPLYSQTNRLTDDTINTHPADIIGSLTGLGRRVKPKPEWQQWATTKAASRAIGG